jgi:hypothetical protein
MDHDQFGLESDILDLTWLSIAGLRSQDNQLLMSSGSRLLRQVYSSAYNSAGGVEPPASRESED